MFSIPSIILTPLCTTQGALRCGPLQQSGPHPDAVYVHSLTHPACSSPPTSVFNQLVPFINGNTGKKEFDGESLTSSLDFILFFSEPDFTSRSTTTPRPTCFKNDSLFKPGMGILDHRNPFQPLTSTDQEMRNVKDRRYFSFMFGF